MPEPVTKTEIDEAVAGWNALLPEYEARGFLVGRDERRAELLQGLREFTDLMEARPDLPMPKGILLSIYLNGTAREQSAQIEYASELLGQPARPPYEGSDILRIVKNFGPVRYWVSAVPPTDTAPSFTSGQAVQLIADAAHVAETARLAQAGTVVGTERAPDGTCTYTVHFPGRTGTQRGWTEGSLTAAPPFGPVTVSTGKVTSLQAAEALLIERGAQIKLQALTLRQPGDSLLADHYALTAAVSEVCGLTGAELLRQLEPQVEEQVRGHVTEHGLELNAPKTALELAASDGQPVTAIIEPVAEQRHDQPAPGKTPTPDVPLSRGGRRP